jgi:hypothetical protein
MTDEQTVVPQQGRGYGWLPDLPDVRDFSFDAVALADQITVPDVVDLRPKCPPVYDQGQLGSCTANSVAFALDFERQKQNESLITPSRLFSSRHDYVGQWLVYPPERPRGLAPGRMSGE